LEVNGHIPGKSAYDLGNHRIDISLDIGLPEPEYPPTVLSKCSVMLSISLHVPLNLSHPVGGIVPLLELGSADRPILSVPEVAIAEDNKSCSFEDDVRLSR